MTEGEERGTFPLFGVPWGWEGGGVGLCEKGF